MDDGSATLSMLIEQARRAAEDRVKVSAAYDFRQVRLLWAQRVGSRVPSQQLILKCCLPPRATFGQIHSRIFS